MDFTKSLMHCSTIAYFMSEGAGKTPRQLWEEAVDSLDQCQQKYDNLTDRLKGMKTGANMQDKIEKLKAKVVELEPHRNDEPLSQTAKSYLKKYYAYLKYGKWSAALDKGNRYTNKGRLAEPDSIALVSSLDGRKYAKNTARLDNNFLTGEPDVIYWDENEPNKLYIIDVKTSWDIETFMDCLGKDLNPLYWWQIQGYFALTGADSGEVSYCLVDTPESILLKEKFYLAQRLNASIDVSTDPEYLEAERELINNMTFGDIPEVARRIKFTVERDDEAIENIYKRVAKCREYLQAIQELHLKGVFPAKSTGDQEVGELEEIM